MISYVVMPESHGYKKMNESNESIKTEKGLILKGDMIDALRKKLNSLSVVSSMSTSIATTTDAATNGTPTGTSTSTTPTTKSTPTIAIPPSSTTTTFIK